MCENPNSVPLSNATIAADVGSGTVRQRIEKIMLLLGVRYPGQDPTPGQTRNLDIADPQHLGQFSRAQVKGLSISRRHKSPLKWHKNSLEDHALEGAILLIPFPLVPGKEAAYSESQLFMFT